MYRVMPEVSPWPVIAVVGCGGTGGFVAEGLCRLLEDGPAQVCLVDHDRVEERNLRRQNFKPGEVGKFKSQALAERLAGDYGRQIAYSVYPYTEDLHHHVFEPGRGGLVIGCVDNPQARQAMAASLTRQWLGHQWWLDAGNGEHSGQVLLGNRAPEHLKRCFFPEEEVVTNLPLPSVQQPSLLAAAPEAEPIRAQLDCAEAVDLGGQSSVINQYMAGLVLEFVSRLLNGSLCWMAGYIDLEAGSLRMVEPTPREVARLAGLKPAGLMAAQGARLPVRRPCPNCGRVHG